MNGIIRNLNKSHLSNKHVNIRELRMTKSLIRLRLSLLKSTVLVDGTNGLILKTTNSLGIMHLEYPFKKINRPMVMYWVIVLYLHGYIQQVLDMHLLHTK